MEGINHVINEDVNSGLPEVCVANDHCSKQSDNSLAVVHLQIIRLTD